MTEDETRAAIVAEAKSWIGTPYVDGAKVKKAGCDCGQLLIGVYAGAGAIEDFDTGYYSPQHHIHSKEERYMGFVLRYAKEIPGSPLPGDIVMFKIGKVYAHGGIVIGWPRIIHVFRLAKVMIEDVSLCTIGGRGLANLPRKFFSLWPPES